MYGVILISFLLFCNLHRNSAMKIHRHWTQKKICLGCVSTQHGAQRPRLTFLLLDNRDFSTAFFNSIPLSGSLAGTMLTSHSSPQLLPLDSNTPVPFGTSKPSTEPVAATSTRPAGDSVSKDR